MAEALALTRLGKICDIVRGGIGDCLVAPIRRQFTYMCCFNSNITELETQLKELEATREDVQMGVDENRRYVRVVGPNVEAWLTRANEVRTEIEGIIQDKAKVKEGCLNGWCPNLKLLYSLSRKAVKKTKVVVDLKADGVQYIHSSYSPPPTRLEPITNRDFIGFESRRLNMEELIEALKHDEINVIGVCGMGGVGKTKMVQEVRKRAKEEKLFDEVAFVSVGQNPDITKVQNSIAENFGLKDFERQDDATTRASLLRRRLSQDNKKILLILDDIWAEFNLEDHGIPLGCSHETFKIIYTSRFRGIWHDVPNKKEIPLEVLLEDEAWQLFREKVGDSADAPDLQPIAKQIVNECGRLPLALVLIGTALLKKSGRNYTKEIWEGVLDRLSSIPADKHMSSLADKHMSSLADKHMSSRLELSYESSADKHMSSLLELSYESLEDEKAKSLFLLCCLFKEDEDIRIEDLARYGFGLSLFDGINEMGKVRHLVLLIVDDLKSRYLLLDREDEEEQRVKVPNLVRDMGVSIASRDKFALVSHGAKSQWSKTVTHEHYTAISVISEEIKELPEGLTYPNLEFLMLQCRELEKLPPDIFEGMGKLKVLELNSFDGFLALQSLRNLAMLSLEGFRGVLDNASLYGNLLNLEILNFRNSKIEELPEEIRELVNLKLLDLTNTKLLNRIPPDVISHLVYLEELHSMGSKFIGWEGEGKEEEGRNANLREFESLDNLNTLKIQIRAHVVIPKLPIFSKLENFVVGITDINDDSDYDSDDDSVYKYLFTETKRILGGKASIPIPLDGGGIDSRLVVRGTGCDDLVRELQLRVGVDGVQQLKVLILDKCDTPECLANTINPAHLPTATVRSQNKTTAPVLATAVFPVLHTLHLNRLHNLREICRGPVPARSFGALTSIRVQNCGRLVTLFQLPIVGCLTQVKRLFISSCSMMEEVIRKEHQEEDNVATNIIVFPKLEVLKLVNLPSLVGFCKGIDQIDFPQVRKLCLKDIPQVNLLFHNNCDLSSISERNSDVGFLSLFPQKVILPVLEVFEVDRLGNIVEIWDKQSTSVNENTLSCGTLRDVKVQRCKKLMNLVPSNILPQLQNLQKLCVKGCPKIESVVFKTEEEEVADDSPLIIPQLRHLTISDMEKLKSFYSSSTASNAQSLFSYQVILPDLEVFEVDQLGNIVEIWDKQSPWLNENTVSFKLRDMKVQQCKTLTNLVPSNILPRLQHLQKLYVEGCPNIESIVFKNEKEEEVAVDSSLIIPQLWHLRISNMENLKSFYSSSTASNAQSLFNHQVKFPRLENLELEGCASLRNIFHPYMDRVLKNLRELIINDCSKMESVIDEEEEVQDGHRTLFPRLSKLELHRLPELRMFCHSTRPLELPLLSEMAICDCPIMDSFSLGHVSTPKLFWHGITRNG